MPSEPAMEVEVEVEVEVAVSGTQPPCSRAEAGREPPRRPLADMLALWIHTHPSCCYCCLIGLSLPGSVVWMVGGGGLAVRVLRGCVAASLHGCVATQRAASLPPHCAASEPGRALWQHWHWALGARHNTLLWPLAREDAA